MGRSFNFLSSAELNEFRKVHTYDWNSPVAAVNEQIVGFELGVDLFAKWLRAFLAGGFPELKISHEGNIHSL
jgi:hypothetical protein